MRRAIFETVCMVFLGKTKKKEGWLAIALYADGVLAAVVQRRRDAKPAVLAALFYPGAKAQAGPTLARLSKEMQTAQYRCSSLLGVGEYQLMMVEAPNVPAEELKTAVTWKLKDMIDFPVADATVDVVDVPVAKNGPAHNHQVFAVAARNSVIEPHQNLFAGGKVKLSAIDIPEMAQRNFSAMLEPEGRGVAMLSFDLDGGLLTVSFGGELYLARRMDVTLNQLLGDDEDKRRQHYDRITLELQRSLDHFERQFHYVAVSRLVLAPTGGSSLHAYLAENLYLPVDMLDLDNLLDLEKVPELKDLSQQARYFMTLGAALRDEGYAS
ncbi:agglutinin biogenesis protein MshI [Pseudoduganella namucuonensis]|uniref:MSHA biogenesis protein MshI n=1 Tax=Pseudoduganella namucuonensis TaxID=1035707 RepID=A0A1I7L5Z5_9BURK|nr:agglutinin biogenesis protein MshI [Pseudoduganella namucuonensis]SFV05058.1 MSHA biogenesis protein MshI [Pseudoduganella namucuonensis]